MPVEFAGEPLTIAFNPNHLTRRLDHCIGEVSFGFTHPSKPAVLRPVLGTNCPP